MPWRLSDSEDGWGHYCDPCAQDMELGQHPDFGEHLESAPETLCVVCGGAVDDPDSPERRSLIELEEAWESSAPLALDDLEQGQSEAQVDKRLRRWGYGDDRVPDSWAHDGSILAWWTEDHDEVVRELIDRDGWVWWWDVFAAIEAITPAGVIEQWRDASPLCEEYAYYNVIMNFARARVQVNGTPVPAPNPEPKPCGLCHEQFIEASLAPRWVRELGRQHLDYCEVCLDASLNGSNDVGADEALDYIRSITGVLGRIPPQNFLKSTREVAAVPLADRSAIYRLLRSRPTPGRVRELFGTWFDALRAAGVLDAESQMMSRGIRSRALDGHMCHSLAERTIDDMLHLAGIPHQREPPYPEGKYRADFRIGETLVEYLGLDGDPAYDLRIREKKRLAKRHDLPLLLIRPRDLADLEKLERKLEGLVGEG